MGSTATRSVVNAKDASILIDIGFYSVLRMMNRPQSGVRMYLLVNPVL